MKDYADMMVSGCSCDSSKIINKHLEGLFTFIVFLKLYKKEYFEYFILLVIVLDKGLSFLQCC